MSPAMLSYGGASGPVKGQKSTAAAPLTSTSVQVAAAAAAAASASMQSTTAAASDAARAAGRHAHIWLVTGPAGCGKSTVAQHLSDALHIPYIEGDQFHTAANIEKMGSGIPLTDSDRWDWLTALREESMREINKGRKGVVLTCSALKRKYRDVIRVAAYYDHHLLIHFIYLDAPEELLLQRVMKRKDHYMGADMVHSQFDILERPSPDEKDVITIDVGRTLEDVQRDALASVIEMLGSDHGGR